MKLILNVPRNIFPDKKEIGDLVEIADNLALRWINAGIAHYPGIREIQKSNKFIFASKKRQGEPLKLNIICGGLIFGYSGFAEAMRNIVYSLYYKGCNVTAQPHDSISTDILNTEKGRVINSLHNIVFNNNYKTVQITMTSPLGVIHRGSAYRIGYVMFETQETPKVFIDSLNVNTDELWVPSTFNLKNFTEAGYTHPIFAMPLGVDIDRFNPDEVKPLDIGLSGKFIFLSIMGWSERKGVSILVEAYLREFSSKDNTVLYLKGAWYNHDKARDEIAQIVSKVNRQDPPEIKIDFNLYSDAQLPGLYKSVNCFVLACYKDDTNIFLGDSVKKIKDIKIGDKVIGLNGRLNKVKNVFRYLNQEEIIKIIPCYVSPIYCTKKHEFPIIRNINKITQRYWKEKIVKKDPKKYLVWEKAENILKDDYLMIPIIKKTRSREVSNDLLWLYGFYLAEGSINKDGICFSINSKEVNYTDEIKKIIKKEFNKECKVYDFSRNRRQVFIYSKDIKNHFISVFGKNNALNKQMPLWFLYLPKNKQEYLARGMFNGDGHIQADKKYGGFYPAYSTTSKILAYQYFHILLRLGCLTSIKERNRKDNNEFKIISNSNVAREIFKINKLSKRNINKGWIDKNYMYVPIREIKIEKYDGDVIDLEVDGETYTTNVVGHNSLGEGWGLNYSEAMSMELPTIGTRCTSQVDFMNDKNSFLIDVEEYRTEPKCNWICPQYIGQKFAIPSMNHLQQLMRQVYSSPELAKEKGNKARKDMVNKFQWKHAANKWYKRLKDLEANL